MSTIRICINKAMRHLPMRARWLQDFLLLLLAIATSIDAMAAGFSLNLLAVNPYLACAIIGVITFAFSFVGVIVGKRSGTWLESKAEIFGGVVLVLMGFKFLIF